MQPSIKEDLIHYLWKSKRIDYSKLATTDGQELIIANWGFHNHDAGPDFSNGKIMLDGMTWAGNIEMHVRSSDWHRHGHSSDPAYDNVILHVVWQHDKEIELSNGGTIPTLEIASLVDNDLIDSYYGLMQNDNKIPCEKLISDIDLDSMNLWLNQVLVQRISQKSQYYEKLLTQYHNDWNQVFFIGLCKYLGTKVNALPFEQLAQSFDLSVLWKNKDQLLKVEALLLGQAGMLTGSSGDDYYLMLRREYQHLAHKYQIQPIDAVAWKFSRMRPANFPTIRIAQLAAIICGQDALFAQVLEINEAKDLDKILKVKTSEYWDDHYRLNKVSSVKEKIIGKNMMDIIAINVVVPLIFLYGKKQDEIKYQDKALYLLENIKQEENKITRLWKSLGITASSAYFSQALIELKNNYCDAKKCLSCSIGNKIMRGI